MPRIDSFLELVVDQRASDLHFHGGGPPLIRHDGDMIALPFRTLSETEVWRFLREIIPPPNQEELNRDWDTDFLYEVANLARFRVNVFRQRSGFGAVFRVIPPT